MLARPDVIATERVCETLYRIILMNSALHLHSGGYRIEMAKAWTKPPN
jgi:hypothetical protein